VRRIVADDRGALTSRMSRFEELRTPLHFAVLRNRPAMVSLLLELGADPLEVDGSGLPAAVYATSPHVDERVMAAIRTMTKGELSSADRSRRGLRAHGLELISAVALADWDVAERLVREDAATINPTNATAVNALHVMAKRGDHRAVAWLLAHGANPNAMWAHWDAEVTPLHLAAAFGHAEVVRMLLAAGADMSIDDSKHHAPPIGWADYFQHPEIVQILEAHASP
jgi:ankyrin repeat protein